MTTVPLSPSRKSLSSSFSHSSGSNRPTSGNVRNSEIINPIRRSFNGTPFSKPSSSVASQRFSGGGGGGFNHSTPVASPSEHPRRSSREIKIISFHDHEDKENGKDQNLDPARVRSPAASTKGTKNFMSPTISAASKVIQSPLKRVLGEKNESVRTSVSSLSEVKGTSVDESDSKAMKSHSQKKGVSFDTKVTYIENRESMKSGEEAFCAPDADTTTKDHTDSWFVNSKNVDKDLVDLDPSFEISPRTSNSVLSPALAPLDVDPSLPPYDPKTNYISPRPQFLLYKPNPRVELYKEGKQLEDIFATQSFTDTEVTDDAQSGDSDKESEDAASSYVVTKEEKLEEVMVSGLNAVKTPEVVVEAKTTSKRQSLTKRGLIGILLILAAAGMWMPFTNSPVMEQGVINNISFPSPYVPAEISDFMRRNFKDLSQKFQQLLHDTHSHISSMMVSLVEQHKVSHYANWSTFVENDLVDGYVINHFSLGTETTYNDNVGVVLKVEKRNVDLFQDEEDVEDELDESLEEYVGDDDSQGFQTETEGIEHEEFLVEEDIADENLEESVGYDGSQGFQAETEGVEHEEFSVEVEDPVPEESSIALRSVVVELMAEDKTVEVARGPVFIESDMVPQLVEVEPVVKEAEEMEMQTSLQIALISEAAFDAQTEVFDATQFDSEEKSETETASIIPETIFESSGLILDKLKGNFSLETLKLRIALVISTILAVVAFIAFIYLKRAFPKLQQTPVPAAHPITVSSKPDCIAKTTTNEHRFQENPSTTDAVSEQCPSEASSYQPSSFNSRRVLKGSINTQSQERKPTKNNRRESLNSSDYSMSPSYGSFTTYDRIPVKKGNGEQEIVTPVRRSSRIRNQVFSP